MPALSFSLSFPTSPSSNYPSFFLYHGLDAVCAPVPGGDVAAVCVSISIYPTSTPVPGGHYYE